MSLSAENNCLGLSQIAIFCLYHKNKGHTKRENIMFTRARRGGRLQQNSDFRKWWGYWTDKLTAAVDIYVRPAQYLFSRHFGMGGGGVG